MFLIKSKLGTYVVSEVRGCHTSYWFNKTKHLIEAILDKHQNISYSNIWQLNDYWGIVQKASTLQNMAIEKHLIIEWVIRWVSEAWPLGGFLMHGHWIGF